MDTSTSTANLNTTTTDNSATTNSSNALRMNTSSSKSMPNKSADDLLSLAFTPPPPTTTTASNPPQTNGTSSTSTLTKPKLPNIFSDLFIDNFDDQIWPLQMIDPRDKEQYDILYPLLYKLPYIIMYYLNEIIFPEVLAHQGLKLSTCG